MQKIQLIIPCYNEAERLPVDRVFSFLNAHARVGICLVNDGSSDDTLQVLHDLQRRLPSRIQVLDLPNNCGKAEAVRQGVLHMLGEADCDYIGYFDADLSTPLDQLTLLLNASGSPPRHQIIAGSRIRRAGASVRRDPWRHYLGRAFATCATLLLELDLYDTQCGAKLFAKDLATKIFPDPFHSRWLFDLELFLRAKAELGPAAFEEAVLEVPLTVWIDPGSSRVRGRDFVVVPRDLMTIWNHYRA